MNFLIMAGHTLDGQKGSGAVGYIHESVETRRVGPAVTENLRKLGQKATYIKLDKPITDSYLYDQVKLANSKGTFDCVVQIHFNAGSSDKDDKQTGTETYYRSSNGKVFAVRVNDKLNKLYRKRDTGARNDKPNLYWLKNTNCPAILIEVCFVDDKDDVKIYNNNFDETCRLIAEGLANKDFADIIEDVEYEVKDEVPEISPTIPATKPKVLNINPKTKSDWVKRLQTHLNSTYRAKLRVDGYVGPATYTAVKNKAIGKKYITKGTLVKLLQEALGGLDIDGSCGPATQARIKEYQKDNKLTVDGSFGPASWKKLFNM